MTPQQLSLDEAPRVQVRPIETARAALLNAKPTPVHRHDPETAWLASVAAALRASGLRQRALIELTAAGDYGCTDWELSCALGSLRTTAGKRRKELQDAGLCERTDRRRMTDTGTSAVVWRVSDLGRQVASALQETEDELGSEQVPAGGGSDSTAPEEGRS